MNNIRYIKINNNNNNIMKRKNKQHTVIICTQYTWIKEMARRFSALRNEIRVKLYTVDKNNKTHI